MDLVEAGRLLEDAVIDGVVAFLVGRRADHAVLEAVAVLSVERQIDCEVAAGPLDLLEALYDLVALLFPDHKEGVPFHLFAELVLPVSEFIPEIIVVEQGLQTLFFHVGKNQHAAGEILSELPDLVHSSLALLLRHMNERDLKMLPALYDGHAAAKIDGLFPLPRNEIDLVCYRRNVSGAR